LTVIAEGVKSQLLLFDDCPPQGCSLKLACVFMYSLFHVLNNQHGEEFAPFRCNKQTVWRLVRYFEDVVTENKLSALIIEGRCLSGEPLRESERLSKLIRTARHFYLSSCDSYCSQRTWEIDESEKVTTIEEREYHSIETGPFILVMDPRFCGLLASCVLPDQGQSHTNNYEMVWTFDPNVVFTAIEYLMARICVRKPHERSRFESLLKACTPHNPSLRLGLMLTTKLAMLMQRQSELEMAINCISSAISSTLELERILQTAVDEVGRALKARQAALVLWQEGTSKPESMSIYQRGSNNAFECAQLDSNSEAAIKCHTLPEAIQSDPIRSSGDNSPSSDSSNLSKEHAPSNSKKAKIELDGQTDAVILSPLEVPIKYRNSTIGVLVVEDDTPGRNWEDEEELMVKTVSDQLAVAISHARLFKRVQAQAVTDPLTGLYNRRYFQDCLDRELRAADQHGSAVSLIMLDLDHLKRINDTLGHRAGDACLAHVGNMMRATVRDVDICARYGGEEFVILLPKCDRDSALNVAERLREAIANTPVAEVGQVTASIGVASYPTCASSCEELIEMADRAMYLAKAAGRNRVRTLMVRTCTDANA
jgi:diguanylate cyclase (GGDEF)-like protein